MTPALWTFAVGFALVGFVAGFLCAASVYSGQLDECWSVEHRMFDAWVGDEEAIADYERTLAAWSRVDRLRSRCP